MDGHWRGERANDATDSDVVMLAFDDHLRDPDLVPGALDELSYEVVLCCSVHWMVARVVKGTCKCAGRRWFKQITYHPETT